jgi:hypothetical protein
VQTLQPGGDGGIDQILEHGAGLDAHDTSNNAAVDFDALGGVAQDDARKSAVVRDQVGPAADQSIRMIRVANHIMGGH